MQSNNNKHAKLNILIMFLFLSGCFQGKMITTEKEFVDTSTGTKNATHSTKTITQSSPTITSTDSGSETIQQQTIIPTVTHIQEKPTPTVATSTPTISMSIPITLSQTPEDDLLIIKSPDQLCQLVPEPSLIPDDYHTEDIYLSGMFNLCDLGEQKAFDLDTGILGDEAIPGNDIVLYLVSASIDGSISYYIQAINGSLITNFQNHKPTEKLCTSLLSSSGMKFAILATEGAIGCAMTKNQRIALFQIESLDPYGIGSLEVSFITWKKPED